MSERPHDFDPASPKSEVVKATANPNCAIERYGFIGDYILPNPGWSQTQQEALNRYGLIGADALS